MSTTDFPQPQRKDGGEPCAECHIQHGETCDICGAVGPGPHAATRSPSPDLIERLTSIGNERLKATPLDDPANYMNVYARLSREDGALLCEAASELSRLRAELDEARAKIDTWVTRACNVDAQLQLQIEQAIVAKSALASMREALTAAQPYIENLIGYSHSHVPDKLLKTKAKIDAALKEGTP